MAIDISYYSDEKDVYHLENWLEHLKTQCPQENLKFFRVNKSINLSHNRVLRMTNNEEIDLYWTDKVPPNEDLLEIYLNSQIWPDTLRKIVALPNKLDGIEALLSNQNYDEIRIGSELGTHESSILNSLGFEVINVPRRSQLEKMLRYGRIDAYLEPIVDKWDSLPKLIIDLRNNKESKLIFLPLRYRVVSSNDTVFRKLMSCTSHDFISYK